MMKDYDIKAITQAVVEALKAMPEHSEAHLSHLSNKVSSKTQTPPTGELGQRQGLVKESGFWDGPYDSKEVGIAIGPAYGLYMHETMTGIGHLEILRELMAGIEEEGMLPVIIRGTRTSDVSFLANDVAKRTGSGIAIGIQSKGTAVIHQKDLYPLTNLELFPQAPVLDLETYRAIGKNAAKYAKGEQVMPLKVKNDILARPKFQVKAALMHTKETEYTIEKGPYIKVVV